MHMELGFLAAALAVQSSSTLATEPPSIEVATVSDVRGAVKINEAGGESGDGTRGYAVAKNSEFVTEPQSSAEIVFEDGTRLEVAESSKVKVVSGPDRNTAGARSAMVRVKLEKGSIRLRQGAGWRVEVETRSAVVALSTSHAMVAVDGTNVAVSNQGLKSEDLVAVCFAATRPGECLAAVDAERREMLTKTLEKKAGKSRAEREIQRSLLGQQDGEGGLNPIVAGMGGVMQSVGQLDVRDLPDDPKLDGNFALLTLDGTQIHRWLPSVDSGSATRIRLELFSSGAFGLPVDSRSVEVLDLDEAQWSTVPGELFVRLAATSSSKTGLEGRGVVGHVEHLDFQTRRGMSQVVVSKDKPGGLEILVQKDTELAVPFGLSCRLGEEPASAGPIVFHEMGQFTVTCDRGSGTGKRAVTLSGRVVDVEIETIEIGNDNVYHLDDVGEPIVASVADELGVTSMVCVQETKHVLGTCLTRGDGGEWRGSVVVKTRENAGSAAKVTLVATLAGGEVRTREAQVALVSPESDPELGNVTPGDSSSPRNDGPALGEFEVGSGGAPLVLRSSGPLSGEGEQLIGLRWSMNVRARLGVVLGKRQRWHVGSELVGHYYPLASYTGGNSGIDPYTRLFDGAVHAATQVMWLTRGTGKRRWSIGSSVAVGYGFMAVIFGYRRPSGDWKSSGDSDGLLSAEFAPLKFYVGRFFVSATVSYKYVESEMHVGAACFGVGLAPGMQWPKPAHGSTTD